MTFWEFLDRTMDRMPGWPSERQWVTIGVFGLAYGLLQMAVANGDLWNVELFKIILQAVIISALIGAVVAYHFTANAHRGAVLDTIPDGTPDDPVNVKEPEQ